MGHRVDTPHVKAAPWGSKAPQIIKVKSEDMDDMDVRRIFLELQWEMPALGVMEFHGHVLAWSTGIQVIDCNKTVSCIDYGCLQYS